MPPTWQQLTPGRQTFLNPAATSVNAFSPGLGGVVMPRRSTTQAFSPYADARGAIAPINPFEALQPAIDAPPPMESFTGKYGVDSMDPSGGKYGVDQMGVSQNKYGIDPSGAQEQTAPNQMGGQVGGQATNVGGNWAALDAHNAEINAAAARFGVPANLLKSMINRESSGNWDANNYVYGGLRNQRMLPFVGIFESTAQSWGLNFDQMIGNKQAQIDGMAKIIQGLAQQYGGFENAAYVYFGGEAALPGNSGFVDEYGMDSSTYGQKAIDGWRQLDQMAGYAGDYGGGGSFSGDWSRVVQGGQLYDWGAFGADSDLGYYGYGTQYGLNGRQHTGADIAAPRWSPYFAPMGGTVMCAGTGNGTAADGSSCSAFGDVGGGAGRVEVLLDNGAVLIYGHSAGAALRPGQRFNAGDLLGQVGTMNSDHVHLEARVRDPNTPSGWRIVDPSTVIGGGGVMPGFGGGGGYQQPTNFLDQYLFRRAA